MGKEREAFDPNAVDRALTAAVPFGKAVESYFAAQPGNRFESSTELYHQARLPSHSTEAFRTMRDVELEAVAVIAAHDEVPYIRASLETYKTARYKYDPAHRVWLFCNWPAGAYQEALPTLDVIRRFQRDNPSLPMAFFTRENKNGTSIGRIRGVANDVPLAASIDSTSLEDRLYVQHDGDLTKQSQGHFYELHSAFVNNPVPATLVTPQTTHQSSNGRFPNMDTVIAWEDHFTNVTSNFYSLGVGLSARGMMAVLGFDEGLGVDEVIELTDRLCGNEDPQWHPTRVIAHQAHIESSARRLYYYLRQGQEGRFWDNGDLQATEPYRRAGVLSGADISISQRDKVLRRLVFERGGLLSQFIENYYYQAKEQNRNVSLSQAIEEARRAGEMALRCLGGPADLMQDAVIRGPKHLAYAEDDTIN